MVTRHSPECRVASAVGFFFFNFMTNVDVNVLNSIGGLVKRLLEICNLLI